jgi:hypothetical protein
MYTIIYNEMYTLLDKMVGDFNKNYDKKKYNWILSGFSPSIVSNMVFVSSFESKYGNMFENIIRGICELNYGKENVPSTIKGVGISDEEYEKYIKSFNKSGQFVISKYDKKKNDGTLSQFRADHLAQGSGRNRTPSTLTQNELPKLLSKQPTLSSKIVEQPADLIFYDKFEGRWKLFEIKAGGDLDSSNAPKNVEKMLKIYASFGNKNANMYFATLYHKNGEGNTWTGIVKRHLGEDSILIGKAFWKQVLRDTSFDDFIKIYQKAFKDTGFDDTLSKLINETAANTPKF